jgi:hypothetical protein
VKVDCANGVGSRPLEVMKNMLTGVLPIELYNAGTDRLNYRVGIFDVASFPRLVVLCVSMIGKTRVLAITCSFLSVVPTM